MYRLLPQGEVAIPQHLPRPAGASAVTGAGRLPSSKPTRKALAMPNVVNRGRRVMGHLGVMRERRGVPAAVGSFSGRNTRLAAASLRDFPLENAAGHAGAQLHFD